MYLATYEYDDIMQVIHYLKVFTLVMNYDTCLVNNRVHAMPKVAYMISYQHTSHI